MTQRLTPEQQAIVVDTLALAERVARPFARRVPDAENEAYLALCEAALSPSRPVVFEAWATVVIRNHLLNLARHERCGRAAIGQPVPLDGCELAAPAGTVTITPLIDRLPDPERSLARDFWIDREPLRRLAARHGTTVYDLRQRLAGIRDKLRGMVEDVPRLAA